MKLENQVVSLDLAKKLKELGVKQESLFNWYEMPGRFGSKWRIRLSRGFLKHEYYAAFTVAELGEMLRPHLNKDIWLSGVGQAMVDAQYMIDEANARARMLIYLLENKLINLTNS